MTNKFLGIAIAVFIGLLAGVSASSMRFENQLLAVKNELAEIRHTQTAGTSGEIAGSTGRNEQIKKEIAEEMGLVPLSTIRERSASFVEMYAYDDRGNLNYGTAGYIGEGFFVTVKHGVIALGDSSRRIVSIKLKLGKNNRIPAEVIDCGVTDIEVDPGDWAILRTKQPVNLPPLTVNPKYDWKFAEPIFRLGNDYSKGIVVSTGYVGQRLDRLITSLTDGHPGASGGGVLNSKGELIGMPVGRMQPDYRFSFILPLRTEMFRKVPHLAELSTN